MECDVAESGELPYHSNVKVHRLMCMELKKFIQRILHIFSDIESARPRCTSGIEPFCSLHTAMDNAKLLIQHCSESSKFYLVITSDRIQSRFERVRNALELCLTQIENVVPPSLAAKISGIIHDLKNAKFLLEPSEDEAGKVVLALLRNDISASGSVNQLELEVLQLAALRLNITSPLDFLKEKRSIKGLLDKVGDTYPTKRKVLEYLLYLLRKYGELVWQHETVSILGQHEEPDYPFIKTEPQVKSVSDMAQVDDLSTLEPPEEFKCPFSRRLMYDPVVIASGKTFERLWIEKWFNEGHMTCPKTHMRLDNLWFTPNIAMKGLISKWCLKNKVTVSEPHRQPKPAFFSSRKTSYSNSVASFGSSIDDLHLQTSHVSHLSSNTDCSLDSPNNKINNKVNCGLSRMKADSLRCQSSTNRHASALASISKLALRPWGSQCDAVENVKKQLNENDLSCHFSSNYVKPLINFLKDAHDLGDVKAQKDGAEVLLAILSCGRVEMPPLHEDEICVLASFLDSKITENVLAIIEVLSGHEDCKSGLVASGILPSILKVLDTEIRESHERAIKILSNLSRESEIVYHIMYFDCIPKLVRVLEDPILATYCIKIIKALCTSEETITAVAETGICISHIAKILEIGTKDEQEDVVAILFSLCNLQAEYCQLAMTGSIVQELVNISVNGNSGGMVTAQELLLLLECHIEGNASQCSKPDVALNLEKSGDCATHCKDKKTSSKSFGFLRRKISGFLHANH
ncbi:hypothetical protein Ddye_007077 [Dipteronia dyeriana]|uniref:RING-type E3 ubiquitin transferase n=1 Tax=Dipteronia dyeriana TaxID=168575 RepID=A0AAD9XJF0_9ROSI|nr:hypothetical protein Ddye_007077 [Dipteronia dyeriana]